MTALQDFIADPDGFLDDNLIQSQWSGNPLRPRPALIFQKATFDGVRQADNANIPLYRVVPISGNQALTMRVNIDFFYAYFCPYGPNETHAIMVGTLSNFMFTTTMDGCTLGVGTAAANGSRRVAHANVTGVGAQNQAAQMGILTVGSLVDKVIDPVAYRGAATAPVPNSVTSIGIRNTGTGAWRFVYQTWSVPNFGGRPTMIRVTQVA